MRESKVLSGFAIVVLDRGFIYVGEVENDGEWCVIHSPRNIRSYGTTEGLGQLALSGPTGTTKLDKCGTVRAPHHALIHIIETDKSLWA